MPLKKIELYKDFGWALWQITESEAALLERMPNHEKVPDTTTHPEKRLEWMAGRVLTAELLERINLPYHGIVKDAYGKPSLIHHNLQFSLSHSYPYVAALFHQRQWAGIDLEQPKEKLIRIAPRVFQDDELSNAGGDINKLCIYWCAKEALIKIYGRKDLVLKENIHIQPFEIAQKGQIVGRLIVNTEERIIPLYYEVDPAFVLVFNIPERHESSPT